MSISIQSIKTNQLQQIPTILLQIETKKYLFNIPDAFQRFRPEHKISNLKSPAFFFTRLQPQYINGFFGFSQTLFSNATIANGSQIFGPPQIKSMLEEIKKSIIVGYCLQPYGFYEFGTGLSVNGINKEQMQGLYGKEEQKQQTEQKKQNATQSDINDPSTYIDPNDKCIFKDENIQLIACLTQTKKQNQQAISCFIGIPNKIPGKVDAKKLKENGVKGKDIGLLLSKGQITLPDGKILKADDFKDPDQPSPCFLLLDIQEIDEIDQLLNNKHIQKIFAENIDANEQNIKLIVHMSDPDILNSQQYSEFINKIIGKENQEIQNMFTSKNIYDFSFKNDQKLVDEFKLVHQKKQAHINLIESFNKKFPEAFAPLNITEVLKNNGNIDQLEKQSIEQNKQALSDVLPQLSQKNKFLAWNYNQYILKPTTKTGYTPLQNYNLQDEPDFKLPDEQVQTLQTKNYEFKANDIDPSITFLGTGSMCPSRLRNVTSILIQNKNDYFLFDCGEGTYNQLLERFGIEKLNEILAHLKLIIITHSHSDHHLGLLHLLNERKKILNDLEKVIVSIPICMSVWFKIYSQYIQNIDDICILIFNQQIAPDYQFQNSKNQPFSFDFLKEQFEDQNQLELTSNDDLQNLHDKVTKNVQIYRQILQKSNTQIYPIFVQHCPQAFGIIAKFYDQDHQNHIKITFSGDTRPCENFINESKDAQIMIHEGTFNDELQQNAEAHEHSTMREAVTSAIKANAKQLIITHFSQRYSKIPEFDFTQLNNENVSESEKQYMKYLCNDTVFAFDQLSGKVSQFWHYGAQTWFIAKNLNIDKEDDQSEDGNQEKTESENKKQKKKDKKQKK